MKTSEFEELTDLELNEMLSAWTIPDPPQRLRARIFPQYRNTWTARSGFTFEIPPGIVEPWYHSLIGRQGRSVVAALLLQAGAVAMLFLTFSSPLARHVMKMNIYVVPLKFYHPMATAAQKSGEGGGGGQLAPTPVAKGSAPKFAARLFIPRAVVVPVPQLPVVPTISAPAPQLDALTYGDPLSKLNDSSAGQGLNGLGNGKGGGLGNGHGDSYGSGEGGGAGGGVFRIGGDVSSPLLISKVEPEYSEEARKAKYSGVVMLSVVIDEHGVPRDIHVVRPVGLGLDEKALEAVARWRFRPALRNGKPVRVQANVEVSFRLL